jgi:hypothetical protein
VLRSVQAQNSLPSSVEIIFFFGRNSPQWARASSFMKFLDHTQRRATVGRTPLGEWSAPRRAPLQITTFSSIHHPGKFSWQPSSLCNYWCWNTVKHNCTILQRMSHLQHARCLGPSSCFVGYKAEACSLLLTNVVLQLQFFSKVFLPLCIFFLSSYLYVSSACQLALFGFPDWGFSVLFPQL